MPSYYLTTLGSLSLRWEPSDESGEFTAPGPLLLLAYLAVSDENRVARDTLSNKMWPGLASSDALERLRHTLNRLPKTAARDLVRRPSNHLVLSSNLACDIWDFDRAYHAGRWSDIVALPPTGFLENVSEAKLGGLRDWADLRNRRLRNARRTAFDHVLRRAADGPPERFLDLARKHVDWDPEHENAQLALIDGYAALGDEAGKQHAYDEYVLVLRELEDVPSAEVERRMATATQRAVADDRWKAIAPSQRAPRLSRSAAAAIAISLLVALGAGWIALNVWLAERSRPRNLTIHDLDATLLVNLAGETETTYEVRLEGQGYRLEPSRRYEDWGNEGHLSPDLSRNATPRSGRRGVDLIEINLRTREERVLLEDRADEQPLAWSPDQKQLVVDLTRFDSNVGLRQRIGVLDIASTRVDTIHERATTGHASAG
ncbi:MAG: hypothetical protein MJB57_03960, partial [Gemmatimonadetes bacterium]|nr:hypothetical protein [Gemmatimonadota bacterium]